MRFLIILAILSLPPLSHAETMDDLYVGERGVFYKKFSDRPFTGPIDDTVFSANPEERISLFKGQMKNGVKIGWWSEYWPNGRLASKGKYIPDPTNRYGMRDGGWVGYFPNGRLMFRGLYKMDKQEGRWEYYKEDGAVNPSFHGLFKNDRKIGD